MSFCEKQVPGEGGAVPLFISTSVTFSGLFYTQIYIFNSTWVNPYRLVPQEGYWWLLGQKETSNSETWMRYANTLPASGLVVSLPVSNCCPPGWFLVLILVFLLRNHSLTTYADKIIQCNVLTNRFFFQNWFFSSHLWFTCDDIHPPFSVVDVLKINTIVNARTWDQFLCQGSYKNNPVLSPIFQRMLFHVFHQENIRFEGA